MENITAKSIYNMISNKMYLSFRLLSNKNNLFHWNQLKSKIVSLKILLNKVGQQFSNYILLIINIIVRINAVLFERLPIEPIKIGIIESNFLSVNCRRKLWRCNCYFWNVMVGKVIVTHKFFWILYFFYNTFCFDWNI